MMETVNGMRAGKVSALRPDKMLWWDGSPVQYIAVRRNLLGSYPEAANYIEQLLADHFMSPRTGFSGSTTNPRLMAQAILEDQARWGVWLNREARSGQGLQGLGASLYRQALREGACQLMPLWILSQKRYGWMSAQIDSRASSADAWAAQGLRLSRLSPNIMVKVPASQRGIEVIRRLVAKGCAVNVTLCFTVAQAAAALRAIREGLAQAKCETGRPHPPHVITFMIGRFASESVLTDEATGAGLLLGLEERRWAELEVYRSIQAVFEDDERKHGDAPVRLLLSSIKTDSEPSGSEHCWHLERTDPARTLYTLTPSIVEFMVRRHLSGRPLVFGGSAREPIPESMLANLRKLPYFMQANRAGGMRSEDFEWHPAFVTASHEITSALQRLDHFVESARCRGLERAS